MMNRGAGRRRIGFAAFTSVLAMAAAGTASAQGTPAGPTTAETTTENPGSIIVTGTRIVRDGFQAPTPLTVMTQEDIENSSPTNNIADFVNQLPSLAGSTRPSNSRLNLSSGQAGINALNLRNLNETRTLILLDGRRSVASTITGLVDINTIPQALVERVEVVTGGASAAYGSDAVAGVVNFVLDKDFEGLRFTGDTGITSRGDGFNYSADITAGTSFADGRGHLTLNAEIAHKDGIFEVDRGWNHTGYVRIQDPNWTASSSTPQFLIRRQVGAANSTPGGLITASAGGVANRLRGLYFGDGGEVLQYQYGDLTFPSPTGSAAPTLTQGGSWRVNDSGRRIGLDAEDDRRGVFGRLSFEVSDGIALFAEGAYNWQEVYFNAGPNLQTGIALQANNAFLINALGPERLAGITSVTLATTAADLPFRGVNNKREVQRYTIGAEGTLQAFGSDAFWDIYGQYGRADLREQLRNIMHIQRMSQATAAVFAPAGNAGGYAAGSIQCAINVDADPANNDPACVPLNRLGLGVADAAAINYVLGDPYRDEVVEQTVVGANLSLTPFNTWAGEVSIAVGAEYREEKIRGFVPEEYQPVVINDRSSNRWSVGNYLPTNGKYDVKEAYLETVIPLGFGLDFNGAVRATDYSTAGYVTTWKAGATWEPIEDIRLRVTRSRDIRAPNLNELYQSGTANSDAVRNPAYTPDGANGPASYSYSGNQVGNLNLRPEKADSWNIGGVLSPSFLPGFNASVDYFRINLKEGINTFTAQNIIDLCFLGNDQFCAAYSIDPARSVPGQPYLLFRTQPFNAASQLVRGIDFDASYRLPLRGEDGFTLRGVATRYIENLFNSGVPGTVPIDSVGALGGGNGLTAQSVTPKWLYRFSASYETQAFTATAVARGVSGGKYVADGVECQTGCPPSTPQAPTYDENRVDGAFYVDLNLTARAADTGFGEAEVFANITNLFDADPILLPETGLAANSTYSDLLGRAFRVGLRLRTR